MSYGIPKSQRVLTPAERAVLEWLERHHDSSFLDVRPSGRVGFVGYVYEAPRVLAPTFLALLAADLIEPAVGWGVPPDVKSRPDGELPEEEPTAGNVVRLRRWRTNLARYFFRLSQMLAGENVAVEPHGFALVLVGADKVEVLSANLTVNEKAQAAQALLRKLMPHGAALVVAHYQIAERGRALLRVSRLEDEIQAAAGHPQTLLKEHHALLLAVPRRGEGRAKAAGLPPKGLP